MPTRQIYRLFTKVRMRIESFENYQMLDISPCGSRQTQVVGQYVKHFAWFHSYVASYILAIEILCNFTIQIEFLS